MKKVLLSLFALLFFTGCMIGTFEQVKRSSVEANQEKLAGIGDVLFVYTEENINKVGEKEYPQVGGSRFDLTIVELTDQKIGLQYSEYTRSTVYIHTLGGGSLPTVSDWMIKQGFNKRFDFDLTSDRFIRFKGYEFEVVEAGKGQIKYRRIK